MPCTYCIYHQTQHHHHTMKTLVVLTALAAVAIAAPALQDRSYERFKQLQSKYLSNIRREKKSSQSVNEDVKAPLEITPEPSTGVRAELESAPAPSARTFKKPIIIKKKHGYHLYRDSEEEKAAADPQESCTQELKFKVCNGDPKSSNEMKSSTIEDAKKQLSESEIESSILMAKEAVENLQKMSQWKNVGPDAELHEDIEVARMALEHVQQNLGNLESMSLRATTLSDTEAAEDTHVKMSKMEEEKMAQWKDAMETIQKNVEIARNIEDSFKSTSEQTHLLPSDDSQKLKVEQRSGKVVDVKHADENDMTVAASELKESKMDLHDIQAKSQKETLKFDHLPVDVKGKAVEKMIEGEHTVIGSELDSSLHEKITDHDRPMSIKAAESENMHLEMEETKHLKDNHRAAKEWDSHKSDEHQKHEKSAWKGTNEKTLLAKSTENIPITEDSKKIELKQRKTNDLNTVTRFKSAEHLIPNQERHNKEIMDSAINNEHENAHFQKSMKSAESTAFTNEFVLNTNQGDPMMMKSADQVAHQTQHNIPSNLEHSKMSPLLHETAMKMKAVDQTNMHHLHVPSHLQTQAPVIHPGNATPMKAAEEMGGFQPQLPLDNFQPQGLLDDFELERHSFVEPQHHHHHHVVPPMHSSHHGHMPHHHHLEHQHYSLPHGHLVHHGKEADMDSVVEPTMQMDMKEATEKSALENKNMLQWKQDNSARGAYAGYGAAGAGGLNLGAVGAAGSGSGAVGVFPHAHVSNCAIPLLLSCSPSVTSGSLVKGHSYGTAAPAYRTEEDFNLHNKRDTKKTNQIPATKVKRTLGKITKKISNYTLEKKL